MSDKSGGHLSPEENFLAELRSETHESHKALEEKETSKAILHRDVTVADYQQYLCGMYGLMKGVEEYVYPKLENIFPELERRKKAHLIEADLVHTGMSREQVEALPVKKFDPKNEGEAAGIMYVLEGSVLGGKILYKHINNALGFDENNGASFFNGYGGSTGSMWKAFLNNFTGYAAANNTNDVIRSSVDTFTAVGEWMGK